MKREDAIKMVESKFWVNLSISDRALFQLQEERLCMPFDVFQESVENWLGRSVYTHEFAKPDILISEGLGESPRPSMLEILQKLPKHLRDNCVIIAQDAVSQQQGPSGPESHKDG